jgi:hypothetical protein
MRALIDVRWMRAHVLVVLLGCSTRDASLGESSEPSPVPVRTCVDGQGICLEPGAGVCPGGTWTSWACANEDLSCCVPAPPPSEPCETLHVGKCIAVDLSCSGQIAEEPSFACNEGRKCCKERVSTGRGGAAAGGSGSTSAGMSPGGGGS